MFTVYALKSLKNGRLYIGYTQDLTRRMIEHNSGKTKSLKYLTPMEVIYTEYCQTRIEARQRELELKSGKGREWLHNITG